MLGRADLAVAEGDPAQAGIARACSRATTRRRARLRLDATEVARRRGAARLRRAVPRHAGPDRSTSAHRAISPRPPPTCSPPCALSTPPAPTAIAVMPIPDAGSGRGHQRPAAARGEGAMSDTATAAALTPELLARLAAIVGPQHALTDPDQQLPYLREWRDMYEGRAVARAAARHDRGSLADPGARQRARHPRGAAGRQYRPRRRPDADARRDRALGRPPQARARARSRRLHHDGRGRPDAGRGPGRGRRASTACFRSACRRRAAARSAATSAPTPAASACWPTATRASWCSASRWCWPTAASGTASSA